MQKTTLLNLLNYASIPWRLRQALAWLGKRVTETRINWIKNKQINLFARYFPINWHEAEYGEAKDYPTFNAFFTRRLKAGTRPIDKTPDTLIFPVDGFVSQYGDIEDDTLLQAKGFYYGVTELVGDAALAQRFKNGQFITLYLAPQNYHRVHIPYEANLSQMRYIPGRFFSVNAATTQTTPQLFTRNERVVTVFETEQGPLAVVFVAAGLVASVVTPWAGAVCPPHGDKVHAWDYSKKTEEGITFNRGEEIGYFALGSTVVILTPEKSLEWCRPMAEQEPVKMGEAMARWKHVVRTYTGL